jgi:hypothetical protein
LTYDVLFRDTRVVSPSGDFGDAVRVEYGSYVLRKRAGSCENAWFLRAPFAGQLQFDVAQLFSELKASRDPERMLRLFGVQPVACLF